MKTRPAYIAGSTRTPFVKSLTTYKNVTLQDMMTATLQSLVNNMHLDGKTLGDVALGAVISSSTNWNLARECVLGTTLDPHTPAYNLQRACGTSLEAVRQIALKISNYQIENGIGGGCDSNSDLPILINRSLTKKLLAMHSHKGFLSKLKFLLSLRPSDFKFIFPQVVEPRTHLSMGEHCELMVKEWKISLEAQNNLALKSHQTGVVAYDEGFYDDLVFEFAGIKRDGTLRADTSIKKLSRLKPSFDFTGTGTLTAGNSSPLTDGAAAVFLTSEEDAKRNDYTLLARFVDAEAAAVDFVHGEGLLMAPTIAVSRLLKRNNLSLQDFDFYEIHEAFAGQVLCTLKAWESPEYCKRVLHRDQPLGSIDQTKMNTKGGSVALGHPFAATGARIVGTLAKMLHQKGSGRGLISICTAGGMGVAAILEGV
ncbi:MAG TPA: acetyl-CoA C-acetyltransferase [Gammaproteobacteria bacterium]|nr:acetyl-CoA C-acetyltransferase [Gammaproteobacteria bacterium]